MSVESQTPPADCRPQFQLTFKKHRTALIVCAAIIIPGTLISLWVWMHSQISLGVTGFYLFTAALLLSRFYLPSLDCPNCNKRTDLPPTQFCPECGARSLEQHGKLVPYMKCGACHKDLKKRKNHRLYIIRFCTHCGAHLHDHGV